MNTERQNTLLSLSSSCGLQTSCLYLCRYLLLSEEATLLGYSS